MMTHQRTELPVIQAPMAGVQGSALAVAVCNAGGLGSLPAAMLGVDDLRKELRAIQAGTDKPYNVNFFCHTPPALQPERELAWRIALAPAYAELALDPAAQVAASARQPFGAEAAAVLAEFRPPVVSFHFGLPAPELLAGVRSWGGKVIASATTVSEALWLQERGVDAIIAQGLEAGGHRGMFLTDDLSTQLGTMALLPQIVKAVRIPVIAAGGIADRNGVVAALALGASAAQVGTAYLLCPEASTSAVHRSALQSASAHHTAVTNVFTGRAARGIVNRAIRDYGPISPLAPAFPLAVAAMAPLRAAAERHGSGDFSPLWAGQNASSCATLPAAVVTRGLAGLL
jgi:nitronate monooxygenase